MRTGKTWTALFALLCLLAVLAGGPESGRAEESKAPEEAARVNGVSISREAVERAESLLADSQGEESAGGRIALERLIAEELLYQEAASRDIKIEKEEVRRVIERVKESMPEGEFSKLVVAHWAVKGEIVKTIERELMIRRLLKEEVLDKVKVPEEEIRAFYEKEKELFRAGPEVRLQQILLFETAQGQTGGVGLKAQEVAARARAGDDFAALALTYSQGPFREHGGDLGWRSIEHLPDNLRAAVEEAPPGEIVGPIHIPRGFVIARLIEHRQSHILPLEEVRDHLLLKLREGRLKKRHEDFMKELRSRFEVEVLPPYAEGQGR